jgi:hypothetical protein
VTVPTVVPDHDTSHESSAGNHAYMEALPDYCNDELVDPYCSEPSPFSDISDRPRLSYRIHFTTLGEYYLHVRLYYRRKDNTVIAWRDELPDSANTMLICGETREWVWTSKVQGEGCMEQQPFRIETEGVHTIHLSMREDGVEIDRFILTTESAFEVGGIGPPESRLLSDGS